MTLWIEETHVNDSENCLLCEPVAYDTGYSEDQRGRLFRQLQREYGRCTSKMYVDTVEGETHTIGWVFSKQEEYEDAPETFIHTTWIAVLKEAPYTVKHYEYYNVA